MIDAAKAQGIRFILMKQEVAGAMLAFYTWGEISGSPGVCLSTRGPGATNMVNGIAHAYLDRAPLIAITDRYSSREHAIGIRQRLNHQAIMQPIVKWSTAIDASVIKQQMRRAVRIATAHALGLCILIFSKVRPKKSWVGSKICKLEPIIIIRTQPVRRLERLLR